VKALKQGEQVRMDLIESFTHKVDSDCNEFMKSMTQSLQDNNSTTAPATDKKKSAPPKQAPIQAPTHTSMQAPTNITQTTMHTTTD